MNKVLIVDSEVLSDVLVDNALGNALNQPSGTYIRSASNAGIDFSTTQDFTFEVIVKLITKSSLNRYIWSRGLETTTHAGYAFIINEVNTSTFNMRLVGIREVVAAVTQQNVEATSVNFTLDKNKFNHFHFVKVGTNANDFKFYVNGVNVAISSQINTYTGGSISSTEPFRSAITLPSVDYCVHLTAMLRLYDIALSQSDVTILYDSDGMIIPVSYSNIKLDVQLNEKQGTTAKDQSSSGNDFTLINYGSSVNTDLGSSNNWKDGYTEQPILS